MANSTLIKKLSTVVAGVTLLTLGIVGTAEAATVVSDNLATIEGNTANSFPFNISSNSCTDCPLPSQRYQQVYSASDFSSLSGPQEITQILFRPDAYAGSAFSSTFSNIQINLSTTSKAPDFLSTTFANNVGSDDTVVFSGPLSLSSAFTGPEDGPMDFDIVINLSTPFLYNPQAGNLLLDVRNFGGGSTTFFDAQSQSGDSMSRVYTFGANNVNSATGSADSVGLITKFVTITPSEPPVQRVPEPSSVLGLLVVGMLGSGSLLKRKQMQ